MRNLFLVLLLANIVYLGWNYVHHTGQPRAAPGLSVPPGARRLVLLSEYEAQSRGGMQQGAGSARAARQTVDAPRVSHTMDKARPGDPRARPLPVAPVQTGAVCYTVGPFEDRAMAQRALRELRDSGLVSRIRDGEGQGVGAYWVYLPPQDSREAAERLVDRLVRAGIDDYYIVTEGRQDNAISLGLFNREEGALSRFKAVRALGLFPRLQVRHSPATIYWVDYRTPGGGASAISLGQPDIGSHPPIQTVSRSCGEIAPRRRIE